MWRVLKSRSQLKRTYTLAYPHGPAPELPEKFMGRPVFGATCPDGCHACVSMCPTGALEIKNGLPTLDMGHCLFCGACQDVCPSKTLCFSRDYALAAAARTDLCVTSETKTAASASSATAQKYFRRSFKLRQVSAGGCNACEADSNVLGTPAWDFGRFGIQFVASPRHADALLVTGPVTQNMKVALLKTYEALPSPCVVIACGSCAISGGAYSGHQEVCDGVDKLIPVDLYIPGCPPHPLTILNGLLRLLGYSAP